MTNGHADTNITIPSFMAKIIASVVAALVVALVLGAVALRDASMENTRNIQQLFQITERLSNTQVSRPRIKGRFKFVLFRLDQLEAKIEANSGRIQKNRDMIMRLQQDASAVWHPPMERPPPIVALYRSLRYNQQTPM